MGPPRRLSSSALLLEPPGVYFCYYRHSRPPHFIDRVSGLPAARLGEMKRSGSKSLEDLLQAGQARAHGTAMGQRKAQRTG